VELGRTKGVRVGKGVDVRIGIRVGFRVGIAVEVSDDEWLTAVWVRKGTRVLEGAIVIVAEAVIVGVAEIRIVAVGVEVSVLVGMVRVGKGPSSALAVPTIAVLIPSAWLCEPPPRLEAVMSRKVTAYTMKTRPMHKIACNRICRGIRFSFFTMTAFLQD